MISMPEASGRGMWRRGKLECQKADRLSYGSQQVVTQKWGESSEKG